MSGSQTAVFPFNEIPQPLYVPGAYTEIRPNYSNMGAVPWPARVLIIGQMAAAGTAVAGAIMTLYRASDAVAWFGAGSQAAGMAKRFLDNNPWTRVDIVGVADSVGATRAGGSVAVTAAATGNGTIALRIAGRRITVGVTSGMATTAIAAAIQAAIVAMAASDATLPVVATVATSTVTLTAVNGGTLGNEISIVASPDAGDALPAGVALTVTAMTGGATDPTADAIITAISSTWYTDLVMPAVLDDAAVTSALETRYAAMGKLDTHLWKCVAGSYSALLTDAGTANSRFKSWLGVQNPRSPSWEIAAACAAQAIFALGNDPARQLRGLPLVGIVPPAAADWFDEAQQNVLLPEGVSTYDVMIDGTMVLQRIVTENKTNPTTGAADQSWLDVMTPKTLSRVRYDWDTYVNLVYPRNKMALDGTIAAESDPAVVTPTRMRGTWAARSRFYETQGWLQNTGPLAQQANFAVDASNPNQMDMSAPVQLLGNLMVLADIISFSLN